MEVGDKLKDLNMTVEEMDSFTKAFKDKKFRQMFHEYAEELSNPENKKRYEEEIKLMEQERGNTVEFIHPKPFRCLRTSENGKLKCFINICSNEKVGKPQCKAGMSDAGRRGQSWSLPHSLHPGRQEKDPKGNKMVIYDVIFHPDTLHIASKNKRFMDMVDGTAMEGIQKTFKVTLDKNNMREIGTKYKGTPQPCITRKPTPGHKAKEHPPSEKPDPLAFPYPDQKNFKPTETQRYQIQPTETTKGPTVPNHTVKYRSYIDLQDFRCSRDSARGPRPKDIVVTIDLPLLKAVGDASLEVKERKLLLESEKPSYRLELPLAYPVDEDRGEAKFNKQKGQLTVTLPVLPSHETVDFSTGAGDEVGQEEEERQVVEADDCEEKERDGQKSEEENGQEAVGEKDLKQQQTAMKSEVEEGGEEGLVGEETVVGRQEHLSKQKRKGENTSEDEEEDIGVDKAEEKLEEPEQENDTDVGSFNLNGDTEIRADDKLRQDVCDGVEEKKYSAGATCPQGDTVVDQCLDAPVSCVVSPRQVNQPVLNTAEDAHSVSKDREGQLESTAEMKTSDVISKAPADEVESGVAFPHQGEPKIPSSSAAAAAASSITEITSQRPEELDEMPAADEVNVTSTEATDNEVCPEEVPACSLEWERGIKPPPAFLREVDEHGNETLISNHTTSAGFDFQNALMFELD